MEAVVHKGKVNFWEIFLVFLNFISVSFLSAIKKTKSINMNITLAANIKCFNLSTPALLEQEPGQGLTVVLYEYFYAG